MHNNKPFEIIVLGPPASGKGTQAGLISATFDIPHISTGTILMNIKKDSSHPLSAEITGYMDSGSLVPTEIVNKLLLERIKQEDCQYGYILDGYPRTAEQVDVIEGAADIDYVFNIDVKDEAIVERISGRRVCKNGHTWHLKYSPTKVDGICDTCGETLFQRDDDKPDVILNRLKNYHANTQPIIEFYEQKGILIKINGEQHIENVYREIVRCLVHDLREKALEVKSS